MDTCNRKALVAIAAGVFGTMLSSSGQAANIYIDSTKALAPGSTGTADNPSYTAYGPGATSTVNNIWKTSDGTVSGSPLDDYLAQVNDNTGAGYTMRSPAGGTTAATFTFAGASLQLPRSGSTLRLKMPNESTLSANLVMGTGGLISSDNTGYHYTIAGSLTVNGSAQIYPPGLIGGQTVGNPPQLLTIVSDLKGQGTLLLASNGGPGLQGDFVLGGTNGANPTNSSAFGGVVQYARNLTVNANGAFGTGTLHQNVSTMTLTLNQADTFGDATTFELLANSAANTVNLAFSGTDVVGSIKIGTTTYEAGTKFGVGFTNPNNMFTGGGALQVIPEPASMGLLALSGLALLRRRK